MGNYLISFNYTNVRGIKRRLQDLEDEDDSYNQIDKELHTPKRKKLMSTSQYIYKTLFLEGQNSDVTIVALNVDFKLHRVYLCQSPYFSSMFSGSWKEAYDDEIHIEIADPNITVDALKIVLGSLYQDEITVEPAQVVPVLGAAILFQLDLLIQQCCDIMKESINIQTVTLYYDTAIQYGLESIRKDCFEWLLGNLVSYVPEHPKKLREVSASLMVKLISSPNLFVIQTEFSIYILLKMWTFLRENLSWDGKSPDCITEAHKFFQNTASKTSESPFLLSTEGDQYKEAFQALRLAHLINHYIDVEMLDMDKIIPLSWLAPIYKSQWYNMLRVDQGVDRGPKQIPEEEFNKICIRCGRILPTDTQHMWRWTGYNFGLDLILTYDRRVLRLKRNDRSLHDYQAAINQQSRRHIVYKFTLASINEQKQVKFMASSGLQNITLNRNEEVKVMTLDKEVTFPLILSANFALTTITAGNSSQEGICEVD